MEVGTSLDVHSACMSTLHLYALEVQAWRPWGGCAYVPIAHAPAHVSHTYTRLPTVTHLSGRSEYVNSHRRCRGSPLLGISLLSSGRYCNTALLLLLQLVLRQVSHRSRLLLLAPRLASGCFLAAAMITSAPAPGFLCVQPEAATILADLSGIPLVTGGRGGRARIKGPYCEGTKGHAHPERHNQVVQSLEQYGLQPMDPVDWVGLGWEGTLCA